MKKLILTFILFFSFVSLFAESTSERQNFDWATNMPWIAAILIGVFTTVVNIIISRQSHRSNMAVNVLSANRQTWINELRNLISEIISVLLLVSLKKECFQKKLESIFLLTTKVEFMLNPDDDKDTELLLAINELTNCCIDIQKGERQIEDLADCIKKVGKLTKPILKTEWEKVKEGK